MIKLILILAFFIFSFWCSKITLETSKEEKNNFIPFVFVYYYGYIFIVTFPFISLTLIILFEIIGK